MHGSKNNLPIAVELPDGSSIRAAEWGGMAVELGAFNSKADPAPFFAGLPEDRCQCPHWGYVVSGELRFDFADRSEVFRAGDCYHVGPGHLPVISAGTEWVEFSPIGPYQQTMEVIGKNMQAGAA